MKNIIKASAFLVIVVGASVSAHAACSKPNTPCSSPAMGTPNAPGCTCVGAGQGTKWGVNK